MGSCTRALLLPAVLLIPAGCDRPYREDVTADGGTSSAPLDAGVDANTNDASPDLRPCRERMFGTPKKVVLPSDIPADQVRSFRLVSKDEAYVSNGQGLRSYAVDAEGNALGQSVGIGFSGLALNHPTFMDDAKTMVFQGSTSASSIDLYRATRPATTSAWATPTKLDFFDALNEYEPWLATDQSLYFGATTAATGEDLFVAPPNGTPWNTPVPLSPLNSSADEGFPVVSADQLLILFMSNREGDPDIWTASRSSMSELFGPPRRLFELSTKEEDRPTFVSADGCTLFFTRREGLTTAGFSLWRATR